MDQTNCILPGISIIQQWSEATLMDNKYQAVTRRPPMKASDLPFGASKSANDIEKFVLSKPFISHEECLKTSNYKKRIKCPCCFNIKTVSINEFLGIKLFNKRKNKKFKV